MKEPNMDEVVRQVKEALGNATSGPWADNVFEPYTTVYSYDHLTEEPDGIIAKCEHEPDALLISNAPDWLRLLIEEREQLRETRDSFQRVGIAEIEKNQRLLEKVAEQDKEIQRYREALNWYADANNYTYQYETDEAEPELLEEPIMADDGDRARQALNQS